MQNSSVLVVEDDSALRESLRTVLTRAGHVVHCWADPAGFLEALPAVSPCVIVADMRMPGCSGIEMCRRLRARGVELPIIFISGESSLQEGIDAMKFGAIEFLVKPFGLDELLTAIDKGLQLDQERLRRIQACAASGGRLKLLTPREREVVGLLRKGYSNSEIMSTLGISLPTAKQYKSEVLRKLDVRSLSQLIQLLEGLEGSS